MNTPKQYGYLWLADLKSSAKRLKEAHPHLKHSQLLDLVAQQHGMRHHHEAQTRHKKYIESLQERDSSGEIHCSYCDGRYLPTCKEERVWHEKRHLTYEKVERTLGYKPATHSEREDVKELAYKVMRSDGFSLKERVTHAMHLIRAHFDRSLEAAILNGYWKEHPNPEIYTAMMDYDESLIPSDVLVEIRKQYGRIEGCINDDRSYWFPENQI